ncbi:MAG: DegV family protein [Anaerolineales bacterium]|jgi:DegV family protein with EDD domain
MTHKALTTAANENGTKTDPGKTFRSRIHIVTDSASAFPNADTVLRPDVTVLPLTIHIGTQSFLEHDGNTLEEIQSLMGCRGTLPVVASPSVEAFLSTFECISQHTRNILCLHSSSRLCRAVRNARTAAEAFAGRVNIIVMDSLTTSAGVGFLIGEALRISDRGASLEEVVRQLRYLVPRMYAVFFVEDLAYLQHTGKISRSQVLLGEMLGIKPFLSLEEGGIIPLEKVQTREQAAEKLVEFIGEFTHLRRLAVVYNAHDGQADGRLMIQRVREVFPGCPVSTAHLGASVASIFGPRSTGLIIFDMPAAGNETVGWEADQ